MIEEVKDSDIHKMNAMIELDAESIHIMESDDDDEQKLFKHQDTKETEYFTLPHMFPQTP